MPVEFGSDGYAKWQRFDPPIFWKPVGGLVVADRHLSDGTRQHLVKGSGKEGLVVRNAQIIWEDAELGRTAEFF